MSRWNKDLGDLGESAAATFYEQKGWKVLERNWRVAEGEIDLIVANNKSELAFVEVKTRSSDVFGSGAEAVDWRKQQTIRKVAAAWMAQSDTYYETSRFDVALVDPTGKVELIENCF